MNLPEAARVFDRVSPPCGLMKIADAAAAAGLNPETVHRRVRRGELRAWGRPLRVRLADLLPEYVPTDRRK